MKLQLVLLASVVFTQPPSRSSPQRLDSAINVTGDAAVNVVPDRVRLSLGVESRHKSLQVAKARTMSTSGR
jgi:uncharacterized protein YggE